MLRALVALVIVLLIGLTISVWSMHPLTAPDAKSGAALAQRLNTLERELAETRKLQDRLQKQLAHEREQRLALVDHISEINAQNDALTATIDNRPRDQGNPLLDPGGYQAQIRTLTDAGFARDDARYIVEMEAQMHQQIMSSRFHGPKVHPRELVLEMHEDLRDELGDEEYGLYLAATGRPTSIEIKQIAQGSAASIAGLRPGDRILSYDGERVFNIRNLREVADDVDSDEQVIIEVIRNGEPLTLLLPAGDLGISVGGFDYNPDRRRDNRSSWRD